MAGSHSGSKLVSEQKKKERMKEEQSEKEIEGIVLCYEALSRIP